MQTSKFPCSDVYVLTLITTICVSNCAPGNTVAYWRFEEGANNAAATSDNSVIDYSGNGHNGTPINAPIYRSDVAQDPLFGTGTANGRSLDFNGVYQRVFIPDSSQFELTHSLTLEAFVYVRSSDTSSFEQQIIYRGDDRGALDPFALSFHQDGFFDLRIESETTELHLQAPVSGYDQWHHVAGTLDDATSELKLYVDGVLAASMFTPVRPLGALDPLSLPGLGIAAFSLTTMRNISTD